ncbi:MAG: sugar phosphate nucleotidyltransferase, partial [Akkermansiaceae bacterium]|nr:sugar phosphate nucleotidyltransferase [Akkermansiaceae bacterium]
MKQAFILGAGLGTRLQPLTHVLPKPLVPLFHQPLAHWALEACKKVGCSRFAINTHHLPEAWEGFGEDEDVSFFHEPVLLETGGGIKNIESWLEDGPLLIHNGDIYSSMPLQKLVDAHEASGNAVTMALRSKGKARHIALDESGTVVRDIHGQCGRAKGTHVFTGVYCVNRSFLGMLPANEKISVIPAFLELAES